MKLYETDSWFKAIGSIVEERIRKAQEEGMFDNLPGKGKPLKLDDDSRIAPHLRASYRILKNAGILPPEMQLRKEISHLRQLLGEAQCEADAQVLVREINEKILALNVMGGFSVSTEMDQIYGEKVLERLSTRKARHKLENIKKADKDPGTRVDGKSAEGNECTDFLLHK